MFGSWQGARILADIETGDLREALRDAKWIMELAQIAYETKQECDGSLTLDDFEEFTKNISSNIVLEIARRLVAYDRAKLSQWKYMKIEDLVEKHLYPEGEFIRAYTMRYREKTGKEIREDEVPPETTIKI